MRVRVRCVRIAQNVHIYKNGHNSVKNRSPDMILTAFERKFDEKNDEIPPGPCRPLKESKKKQWVKVGAQKVEKKQCRERGFIYIYLYTFTYLHVPLYTSK